VPPDSDRTVAETARLTIRRVEPADASALAELSRIPT
jgi:hypothetical protein